MQSIDFRTNGSADVAVQNQTGSNGKQSQSSVADQFLELLGKARSDVTESLGMTATRSATVPMPEHVKADPQRDNRPAEKADTGRDRAEARRSDNDRRDDHREAPRADNTDDRDRQQVADRKDDRVDARSDKHDDGANHKANDDHHADKANDKPEAAKKADAADSGARTDSQDTATAGDDTAKTATDTAEAAQAATAEATAEAVDTLVTGQQEDPALVAVAAAAASTQTQTQKAEGPVQQTVDPTQQTEAKVEGPAHKEGHVGQQWKTNPNEALRTDTHGQAQQNQAQQNQAQNAADAAQQAQAKLAGVSDPNANAKQQAAQLSQMVGEGNRISVKTQVTDESQTLSSKPSNTLSNASILSGDGTKQTSAQGQQNGPQAGLHANPQQVAQQAAAGPAQAQNNQAAAQAAQQAATTAGTEAKGPVQPGIHNAAQAQTPTGLGGEAQGTATTPGNTANTTQAQHGQQTQAAAQPKFTLPGQSVTDQVNVQITKALQNGMDKINIQLKPANMGRVEVALEMSHDGRISAVVTADNKDTLNLLQKDAGQLAQSLQDAGLQLEGNGLQFSLREQHGDGGQGGDAFAGGGEIGEEDFAGFDDGDPFGADDLPSYAGGTRADGRLDIRA